MVVGLRIANAKGRDTAQAVEVFVSVTGPTWEGDELSKTRSTRKTRT
jgi:hypothetical protein